MVSQYLPKRSSLDALFGAKIEVAASEDEVKVLEKSARRSTTFSKLFGSGSAMIEPAFAPLGFDWKMAVALQTGLAAKEVVVSTMGVLYSLGSDATEEDSSLLTTISSQIPLAFGGSVYRCDYDLSAVFGGIGCLYP